MSEMDSHVIGQTLIKLRGNRTQEEVAKAIGISKSALSMYERGERIPRDAFYWGYMTAMKRCEKAGVVR